MTEVVGPVASLLSEYSGRQVYLLSYPGNPGDGLIHRGFRQLARRYRLTVTEVAPAMCPDRGRLLLVQGGGNLASHYTDLVDALPEVVGRFDRVVLLPCSVDCSVSRVRDLLETLRKHPDCKVICRERESLEALRQVVGNSVGVAIDHDLAFSADLSGWRREGRGCLHAFRLDAEAAGMPLPDDNFDLSALGDHTDDVLLMDLIAEYAVVRTNRAHIAIAAALTGKQVEMFPNSYHKLKGIYDYSLASRTNVAYLDDFTDFRRWCAERPEEIAGGCRRRDGYLRLLQHPPREADLLRQHPPC